MRRSFTLLYIVILMTLTASAVGRTLILRNGWTMSDGTHSYTCSLPADENMGLLRAVKLHIVDGVRLSHPFVTSVVDTATLASADLTVHAVLANHRDRPVSGVLCGRFEGGAFSVPVELKAHEQRSVAVTPAEAACLHVSHPRLWWCAGMGQPNLYHLSLTDAHGQIVTTDCWVAKENDEYDWKKANWYETPIKVLASYRRLNALPSAKVTVKVGRKGNDGGKGCVNCDGNDIDLTLINHTCRVAYCTELVAVDAKGMPVPYAFFTDNYGNLVRLFKTYMGCTPTEYRERHRAKV